MESNIKHWNNERSDITVITILSFFYITVIKQIKSQWFVKVKWVNPDK